MADKEKLPHISENCFKVVDRLAFILYSCFNIMPIRPILCLQGSYCLLLGSGNCPFRPAFRTACAKQQDFRMMLRNPMKGECPYNIYNRQFKQGMDWICLNGWQRGKKKKSIIRDLQNLNLNEESRPRALQGFDKYAFKSTFLQQTFKNYHYTDCTPPSQQPQVESGPSEPPSKPQQPVSEFTLLLPSQYEQISILIIVSLDFSKEYIRYTSYPLKESQMLVLSNEQIVVLSRFFSYHLNSRIISGCVSVDPETGCLTHQIINNSLGYLEKRIMKVPEQLVSYLAAEIKEVQKIWKSILPTIFHLLHLHEKKIGNHSFWKAFKDKRASLGQEEQILLLEYVKQSFIEFPEMFDESLNEPPRRIRSKFLSRDEKSKKYNQLRSKTDVLNFNSIKFTKDINAVLQLFTGSETVKQEADLTKKQIPPEKIKEVCALLLVQRYESRTPILSKIVISQIRREYDLAKSGFSELKILHILGQKVEENGFNSQYIVAKSTQQCRFVNETETLKFVGAGKSLFITRYFFNQNHPEKILLEYCPQKSIDAYLTAHRKFISFQTKLFFLYEIAVGIRFLRDYGITHNDLKPQNVLLKIVGDRIRNRSATFLTKLIDLGQSYSKYQRQLLQNNRYRRGFTLPYAPPQQVRYEKYSEKTDVFSIGVMIYEFIFDIFPLEVMKKKREVYISEDHYLKLYSLAPERCKASSFPKIMMLMYQLVLRCIHPQPVSRPSIDWIIIILKEILGLAEKVSSF